MARFPLALRVLGPATAIVALSLPASADPRTSFLAEQLKTSDDYRVRTQAALALGASGDDAAVQPLCGALGDASEPVKVAAAAALGKLAKSGGLACLKDAEKREASASVKAQIQKSMAAIEGGSGAPPPVGPDTKVYVAIQVTNKTKRPSAEVEALIRAAMQSKILAKAGYAVAPRAETPAQGGQIVKSKKLKGFFLIATVEAPVYAGGELSQIVRVSMWSYPDKALQAELAPKLTQSGTPSADPKSETELMKLCVDNAVETFQKIVASM